MLSVLGLQLAGAFSDDDEVGSDFVGMLSLMGSQLAASVADENNMGSTSR